jgi:hypothetical protein
MYCHGKRNRANQKDGLLEENQALIYSLIVTPYFLPLVQHPSVFSV